MKSSSQQGVLLALSAYGLWAVAPIYFKWIDHIAPLTILSHRVIWSFLLTLLILSVSKKLNLTWQTLNNKKHLFLLSVSTLLIGANWGIFIWAVNSNNMLSASLGYYINPLINILLGMLFFAEKLDRVKKIAAGLCLVAVAFEIIQFGAIPWIALILATTFALYGLVRKKLAIDSFVGMGLETALLIPFAIGYLVWANLSQPFNVNDLFTAELGQLFFAGPVTMVPLLCFAAAANRVSLTALGFFQYIGPTGMLLLAVVVYQEPLAPAKLITFGLIWLALALLVWQNAKRAVSG